MLRPGVSRSCLCSLRICCIIFGEIWPHAHWFTAQGPPHKYRAPM
jgi:hypothetical protein